MTKLLPSVDFILKILRTIGLDPRTKHKSKFILQAFNFAIMVTFNISTILEASLNWKGFETVTKLTFAPVILMFMAKSGFLIKNNKLLHKILKTPFWSLDKFDPKLEQQLMQQHKHIFLFLKMYMLSCTIIVVPYVMMPILTSKRTVIFEGYEICDFQNINCFIANLVWQTVTYLTQILILVIGFDGLFLLFIFRGYCAIQMVKYGFKNLDIDDKNMTAFKEILNQHNIVLIYMKNLKKFYSTELIIQFWSSLGSLICALYMITSEGLIKYFSFPPKLYLLAVNGILYIIFAIQLFIYCMGGAILMDEIKTVGDVVYTLNWWCNTKVRKQLSFIIKRSQYGDKLKAGNMIDLNLESFVVVLKNSLSIYTLLQTLGQHDTIL